MRRSPASMAAALAALAVLTGCASQPTATPTPSPAPSFLCTPEAGGEQYSCDQRAYDEMKAKDALYAEAEEVYRKLFAEEVRLYREGAPISLTITKLAKGEYLLTSEERHRQQNERGGRSVGGDFQLTYVRRNPDAVKAGSVVSLNICVDATSVKEMQGSRELGTGSRVREALYFVTGEDGLKVSGIDAQEVSTC